MSIGGLCALLDQQTPEYAEEFVLIYGNSRLCNGVLLDAIKRRKDILANAVSQAQHALTAIYGGPAKSLPGADMDERLPDYNKERIIYNVDPHMGKRNREFFELFLHWPPAEQTALLEFLEQGLRIPAKQRTEAAEELAAHIGKRYLPKMNKCLELAITGIEPSPKDTYLREVKVVITYNKDLGTDGLQKVFTKPLILYPGSIFERGAYDDRLIVSESSMQFQLRLPEFNASFRRIYKHKDDLERTLTRFMDTNPFRAPPPNLRALKFIKECPWDNVPRWPPSGGNLMYRNRVMVYFMRDGWQVERQDRLY